MSKYGEPWTQYPDGSIYSGIRELMEDAPVGYGGCEHTWDREMSDRAIACVNALEGLNPEAVKELVGAAKHVMHRMKWLPEDADLIQLRKAMEKLESV